MSGEERIKPEWVIERQGRKAVLYAGLLHLAHEQGLKSIEVTLIQCPAAANGNTAICHAEVETEKGRFADVGDANDGNLNAMMLPHLIRMAATRAKARALRDALDIGYVTVEELQDVEALGAAGPTTARRPGVATNGAARVDADLGRLGSSAAPRPVQRANPQDGPAYDESGAFPPAGYDGGAGSASPPATEKQLQSIARMSRALGREVATEGLTRYAASTLISDMGEEMSRQRSAP